MAGRDLVGQAESLATPRDETDQARRLVRQAFSHHLRRTPNLPNSIARSIAADIETLPLALSRDGLAADRPCEKKGAPRQSWPGSPKAVTAPVQKRAQAPSLLNSIADLSESLRERLIAWHKLPDTLVHEVVTHGREGAIAMALASPQVQATPDQAAALLQGINLLTPTLLLRVLCLGQLSFATAGLARRAGVPLSDVEQRLRNQGAEGFASLYEAAQIPDELQRAFRAALQVLPLGAPGANGLAARQVTGAIIAQLVKAYDEVCPEDLEHVLCQLTRRSLEQRPPIGPLRPAIA